MAEYKPNKGNGKGPILGSGNQPISETDRVKYKAVDNKQTKMLKTSNTLAEKKQTAIKNAVAGKGAKKVAAVAKKPVAAKPVAKKAAPKKGK